MATGVTIKGIDDVLKTLEPLTPGEFQRRAQNAAFAVGVEVQGIMMVYPPPPQGSTYRRTGTLKRGWGVKRQRTSAIVGNPIPYGPWVQSAEQQTRVHQATGWRTDADGVRELEKRGGTIERIVLDALLK